MIATVEQLGLISLLAAILTGGIAYVLLVQPAWAARACAAFPRNHIAGFVLAAAGLVWSALLINQMTLGEISRYKPLLYILTPLSFFLIVRYLDELLAARALGGMLLLVPTLMTDAARWHPSAWRLVVVTLAYAMIITGIWLVLSPYKFRVWTQKLLEKPQRQRIAGATAAVISALLLITAIVTR